MSQGLSRTQVSACLQDLQNGLHEEACRTCDCFQGVITQLELDAGEDVADLVGPLKVPASQMHGCLGCDPCPPGSAFARYLRGMVQSGIRRTSCEDNCDCRTEQ